MTTNQITRVFTIIIAILLTIITILIHNIEGVNIGAYYCIVLPLVAIRFIRAILLMKIQ